ncbi:MAG: hypothetical protein Kow0079_09650 [Vicingaceae bacterium]
MLGGLAATQVEGDGYGGYNKAGIIAGGFVNHDFSEKLSLQFEIVYIQKGSRKNPHPDKGDNDFFLFRVNYAEIPLILKYKIKIFHFEIGAFYGNLLNYYIEDEVGVRDFYKYPLKKYEFGGLFGAYIHLNKDFSLNIRSKNSIIPIRDFENQDRVIGLLNKLFEKGWYNIELNMSLRYTLPSKN